MKTRLKFPVHKLNDEILEINLDLISGEVLSLKKMKKAEMIDTDKIMEFIGDQCSKHGVIFLPCHTSGIPYPPNPEFKVNGYFLESPKPVLAVATKKEDDQTWIDTLVHEYGHMTQWLDNAEAYTDRVVSGAFECYDIIDLWIERKIELSPEQLEEFISKCIECEADCERRTVNILRNFGCTEEYLEGYCQRANSYLYFYFAVAKHRSWYVIGREPYTTKEIWLNMPKVLRETKHEVCPDVYMELFDKHCLS